LPGETDETTIDLEKEDPDWYSVCAVSPESGDLFRMKEAGVHSVGEPTDPEQRWVYIVRPIDVFAQIPAKMTTTKTKSSTTAAGSTDDDDAPPPPPTYYKLAFLRRTDLPDIQKRLFAKQMPCTFQDPETGEEHPAYRDVLVFKFDLTATDDDDDNECLSSCPVKFNYFYEEGIINAY
jgi:hypothetical protein